MSLDNVFSNEEPQEEIKTEPEVVEEVESSETNEGDVTAEESKGDELGSTPEPEATQEPEKSEDPWTKTAYMDEKRKRQEVERRLQEYEAQRQKQPEPEAPDLFADPEGYHKYQQQQQAQMQQKMLWQTSEMVMRSLHPDFEEKLNVFGQIAQDTPLLLDRAMQHPNPAQFVYETAKKHQEIQELGGIENFKSETEKRVRAELEAEIRAKVTAELTEQAKKQAIKPGPANAGGKTPVGNAATNEPMEGLFKSY